MSFLLDRLCNYAFKWDSIGSALNFLPAELENIRCNPHMTNLQQCLHALLTQWSHWPTTAHPHRATVEKLCGALRSNLVGLGDVANEIEEIKASLPRKMASQQVCWHCVRKAMHKLCLVAAKLALMSRKFEKLI